MMSAGQIAPVALGWVATIVACLLLAGVTYNLMIRLRIRVRIARRLHIATDSVNDLRIERRMADGATELKSSIGNTVASLGRLMPLGDEDRAKIALSLNRAGYLSANALAIMLGIKFAGLVTGLLVGLAVSANILPGLLGLLVGLVGGALVGVLLNVVPELVLGRLAARRLRRIGAGLAETFDLLVVCLESGLTFERALKRTVDNLRWFQPDLAKEFSQVVLDMSMHGRNREDALGRLADRVDNQDFRDLSITVTQSQRHGTPLADALRKLSGSVRVEQIARMQEKMARLPTFLILPSIACILPGIMVIVGGPSMMELLESMGKFGDL